MIRAVFIWLGGVLTEPIIQATAGALSIRLTGNPDLRGKLSDLADQLTCGHVAAPEFCRRAVDVSSSPLSGEELEHRLLKGMRLRVPVLDVLRELPDDLSVWLVSDYPAKWLSSMEQVPELETLLPQGHILFTAELELPRIIPEVFPRLVEGAAVPKERCLLIDSASSRAVEAIRHGMPAAIYVDPIRLRREFVLRQIIPPPPGFVFPVGFRPMD